METKTCIKCNLIKPINQFYKHSGMKDGHLNNCIDCFTWAIKISSRRIKKNCLICRKEFGTCISEIRRNGGKVCSRSCYYDYLKKVVKRGENSPNWKGDKVNRNGLHRWVEIYLGKPKKCDFCGTITAKKYEWANKSREYHRKLSDWIRLCNKCHQVYDNTLVKRKQILIKKYGWKFKN